MNAVETVFQGIGNEIVFFRIIRMTSIIQKQPIKFCSEEKISEQVLKKLEEYLWKSS